MRMPHHRDKNGREIYGGALLLHDNGQLYEVMGTGVKLPGDGPALLTWNKDNKLAWVATESVIVYDGWFSHWLSQQPTIGKWCLLLAVFVVFTLLTLGVFR